MLYMLDSANIEEIRKACDVFPLAGVTTNPSIITREKKDFFSLLKEIRSVIGDKMMHVQVLGTTTEDMLKDAACIREKVEGSLFVKIPVLIA